MKSDGLKTPIEISKELEIINFKNLLLKYNQITAQKDDIVTIINKENGRNGTMKNNKVTPEIGNAKRRDEPMTQFASFQRAMRPLLIIGQTLGLNPVKGFLETNIVNIRFAICSWRSLYSLTIGVTQLLITIACFYRLLKGHVIIGALGYVSFYCTTCVTTFLFIQIGYKWPKLIKTISKCGLDEYIDPQLKCKCYLVTVGFISLALFEHFLSLLYKIENIMVCRENVDYYEEFLKDQFPWYVELDASTNLPMGIILQIINIISTVNWNYADLFIICMSMYLTSILKLINEKIKSASTKHYLPSSYWRVLREDYNRATRLVRSFDDVFSGIIFTSFASNLFFICLQIYHVLAYGVGLKQNLRHVCDKQFSGPLGGHEYTIYLLSSVFYLLMRSLAVSLVAASVHTASLVPAPALYSVPSSAYCEEVARFITQVNEDTIALSGLQFFYVTRDLVLTVAGTIVTYELVLIQFSKEEDIK